MDNKSKKDYRDRSKIDMNDPNEVAYAMRVWGCTKQELEEAVRATKSNSRKKIYNYLQRPKS